MLLLRRASDDDSPVRFAHSSWSPRFLHFAKWYTQQIGRAPDGSLHHLARDASLFSDSVERVLVYLNPQEPRSARHHPQARLTDRRKEFQIRQVFWPPAEDFLRLVN
jgi:hypothetical protein